jgi:hypothetical protein
MIDQEVGFGMSMTRKIQFYYPDRLLLEMDAEAKRRGISMAELVRRAVEVYLRHAGQDSEGEEDPLDRMAGFFDGDEDLSEKHDLCLYGRYKS